jgi:hypothetical protein
MILTAEYAIADIEHVGGRPILAAHITLGGVRMFGQGDEFTSGHGRFPLIIYVCVLSDQIISPFGYQGNIQAFLEYPHIRIFSCCYMGESLPQILTVLPL